MLFHREAFIFGLGLNSACVSFASTKKIMLLGKKSALMWCGLCLFAFAFASFRLFIQFQETGTKLKEN